MRPGLPVDGGQLLGPPDRYFQHAPALFRVIERRDFKRADGDGTGTGPAFPAVKTRHAAFARAETARHPALGLEPFCRAQVCLRQPCGDPRPCRGRAPPALGGSGETLYGRGAGTDAHRRVQKGRGKAAVFPAVADGARGRPEARPAAIAGAGPGLAGVRAGGAVLHAVARRLS